MGHRSSRVTRQLRHRAEVAHSGYPRKPAAGHGPAAGFFCACIDAESSRSPGSPRQTSMRCHVKLSDVAADIRDGDLLLFRGRGAIARLIGVAGRSDYTHAARAVWWGNDLFCCEVRELRGGRAVTLESQVRQVPRAHRRLRGESLEPLAGVRPPRRRAIHAAAGWLRLRLSRGAPGGAAARAAVAIPGPPGQRRPDASPDQPPFCSQASTMADRLGGGVDPVPHLADRLTEPADLARSPFYRYRFTLAGV